MSYLTDMGLLKVDWNKGSGKTTYCIDLATRLGIPLVVGSDQLKRDLLEARPKLNVLNTDEARQQRPPFAVYDDTTVTQGPGIWIRTPLTPPTK